MELILGKVNVFTDDRLKSFDKIGDVVNVGLNIVDPIRRLAVPELARLITTFDKKKKDYDYEIELSSLAVKTLKDYYAHDPPIFDAIVKFSSQSQNIDHMTVNDIYGKIPGQDNNARILKTYFWLLSHPTSNFLKYNQNSIMCTTTHIAKVQEQLAKAKDLPIDGKKIQIDPNFVHLFDPERYIQPHYLGVPPVHALYDRVVVLNTRAAPYFPIHGMLGTIIGILKEQYEILLDEPFLGGTNLQGRTPWFRGIIVHYNDLFNITV